MYKKLTHSLLSVMALSAMAYAGGDIEEIKPLEVDVVEASKYAVGLKVGTLGAGLDISRSINEKLNIRFNINGATYSDTRCESNVEYDYDLTLATAGLLVDYFPMNNGFRISAGAYYNGNEFELTAQPQGGSYNINGVTYTTAQIGSLAGLIEFDELAPYIGIGWGNTTKTKGWGFYADAGIMYHGEPQVTLTPTCGSAVTAAACTTIQNDVEAERLDLVNELSDYKIYPVVALGVTYTF